ncbi:MAG: response regulator [Cyanobacteria bacterium P01_G01_bin.38]
MSPSPSRSDTATGSHSIPLALPPPSTHKNPVLALSPQPTHTDFKVYTVACIDHSLETLQTLKTFLEDDLFWVVPMQNPVQALTDLTKYPPDLIFLDLDMPNMSSYDIAELIRKNNQFVDTPVILMTENAKNIDSQKSKVLNTQHFLVKPFSQVEMITTIFPMLT